MPDIDKTTNVESSSIRKSCVRLSLFTAKKKYFPNFLTKQQNNECRAWISYNDILSAKSCLPEARSSQSCVNGAESLTRESRLLELYTF